MPNREHPAISVCPINPAATHALRHAVLRPNQPLAEMVYAGDDQPTTVHLGAFEDGHAGPRTIGIASLYITPKPGDGQPGDWRLRGMAVDPAWQGRGVGRLLIRASLQSIRQRGGTRLWCNARDTATGFYARLGFAIHGEQFEIVDIGPHYLMSIAVAAAPR